MTLSTCFTLVSGLLLLLFTETLGGSFGAANSRFQSTRLVGRTVKATRGLSQFRGGVRCEWNTEIEDCEVSRAAVGQILSRSNSLLSGFTLALLTCQLQETEKECLNSSCEWTGDECIAGGEVFGDASIVGCFGEASVFLLTDQNNVKCRAIRAPTECNDDSTCSWSEVQGSCVFDLVKSLTGIPTEGDEPQGLQKVLSDMTRKITTQFQEAFDSTQDSFLWDEVLDWEVPAMECPEGIDPTVCAFANPFLELFPTTVYCRGKYSGSRDIERCSSDPLCEAGWSNCDTSPSLFRSAQHSAYQVFVEAIEEPLIRDIMNQTFTCAVASSKKQCERNCEWNEGSCEMSSAWMNRKLGETVSAQTDPACRFLAAVFQSNCMTKNSRDDCSASDQCTWDPLEDGCGPSDAVFRNLVLDDDPVLRRQYNKQSRTCKTATEAEACAAL